MTAWNDRDGARARTAPPLIAKTGAALEAWAEIVMAAPRRTLLALVAASAAAVYLALTLLSVDTDSSRMLREDLPFQQRSLEMREAFPDVKTALVAAIEAESPDAADAVAAVLVAKLEPRQEVFQSVFAASVHPFFLQHGFLYGEQEEVENRLTSLASAANLIARLREEPTLPEFLSAAAEARRLSERSEADRAGLEAFQREAAAVIAAHAAGAPRAFAWTGLLDAEPSARTVRSVVLQPKLDFSLLNPGKPALLAARAAIAELPPELTRGVEIEVTGDPALRADELASVTATILLSLVLSLALVALALRAACGSAARAGLALAILAVSLVLTAGAAALLASPLNLVSIAFIVLMVGLGVDYAIHLLLFVEERVRRGFAARYVMRRAGRELGPPLALSALTTALAFLAFTATDFVGMAQLGLIGGVGVIIAFATAVTLTPAVVALWPSVLSGGARPLLPDLAARLGLGDRLEPGATRFWILRPEQQDRLARAAPKAAAFLAFLALLALPLARFDADPMNLRNPDAPSVRAFSILAADGAAAPLAISVLAADDADAAATAERLEALDAVSSARWIGDFIPEDQEDKFFYMEAVFPSLEAAVRGEAEVFEATGLRTPSALADDIDAAAPAARSEAATALSQALRAYAAASGRDNAALETDLYRFFPAFLARIEAMLEAEGATLEALPAPLKRRFAAEDGRRRVEVAPAGDATDPAALRLFAEAALAEEPRASGGPVQIAGAAATVSSAMTQATLLALTATAFIAWAALRSFALTAAILAPLIAAGAMTAAAGSLLGVPFNYANVIVLPLIIGVGVDSGVHLAMRDVAVGPKKSVFSTSTPRAVVYSALTTMAAFGTLALSEHPGTASMGALLAIGLGAALFAVLALTPVFIRWAEAARAARFSALGSDPRPTSPDAEPRGRSLTALQAADRSASP